MEKIRLNKLISESGICSRREADKYIEKGQVLVNGKRVEIGSSVNKNDKILVNGLLVEPKVEEDFVILALNKPVGIVSTTENGVRDNIVDYVGYHERIFPVGRLDKDSQGLIFLTNNGDIVNKILRAGNSHEKEYIVTVNKPITDDFVRRMSSGVPILGVVTKKCKVKKVSPYIFNIILVQGLNRQIRRMCGYLGYEVQKLERVRIMNISLKGIALGEWRFLEPNEISEIKAAIAHSTNDVLPKETKQSKSKPKGKTFANAHLSEKRNKSSSPHFTKKSKSSSSKTNPVFNPKAKELRGKDKQKTTSYKSRHAK